MEIKTYDHNNNPVYRKVGIKLTNKWRKESHLESFKTNGNGWWWFVGVSRLKYKKTWVEKFRKEEINNE